MPVPFHSIALQVLGRCYDPGFTPANPKIDLTDLGFRQTDVILGTDLQGNLAAQGCVAISDAMPGSPLVSIAGTKTPGQWFLDFLAVLMDSDFCPGCQTEAGFTDFYHTLRLGSGMGLRQAFAGVSGVIAQGHSLGGPLATMLAGDCKADELIGFASPKPGNDVFARWIRSRVSKITLYANAPDVVPHVPLTIDFIEDFEHVDLITGLNSRGLTKHSLECYHNWRTYLALIDPSQSLLPECAV